MHRSGLFIGLTSVLLLSACSSSEATLRARGNVGAACERNEDCVTPMDYMIRSSCPFTSLCVEGTCAVACPQHEAKPGATWNDPMRCAEDADCDCGGYVANDLGRCACVDGACMAIVKE